MNNKLLYFYVFAIILFADAYFIFPWLRPVTILNYILLFHFLLSKKPKLPKRVITLQNVFYLFTVFTLLVDLYQNGIDKAVSTFIIYIPVPIVFGIFYSSSINEKLIYYYAKIYLIYNGFFACLQIAGIPITAGELLANLPILGVDYGFAGIGRATQGLRISGASYSTIGFACNLGVLFCYFLFNKNTTFFTKKYRLVYLVLIFFMMIFSQTRSVIFSIIPVVYISSVLFSEKGFKGKVRSSLVLGFLVLMLFAISPLIRKAYPRLFLSAEEDYTIVHRVQSNVFGVVGTFYSSPFIGTSVNNAKGTVVSGYNKVGLFFGDYFVSEVTHHNQPAYFFRYYGFIGLLFFILIYMYFFKIGFSNNYMPYKKMIFAIVLFHIAFTLFHNNKFSSDVYLWLFIALNKINYIKFTKVNEAGYEYS